MLINHFLDIFSPNQPIGIEQDAVNLLTEYPWPGNISELENIIERLVTINSGSDITTEDIPIELKLPTPQKFDQSSNITSFHDIIKSTERELISWAMRKTDGNKTRAARLLSMKPSTFRDALAKHSSQIDLDN